MTKPLFAPRNRSKLLVAAILSIAVAVAIASRSFLESGDGLPAMAAIDCSRLHPTIAEVQGQRFEVDRDSVCRAIRELATAAPLSTTFVDDETDPWHYIARVRIQPDEGAWFLVFAARRSTGFRPELSVRHRREGGWASLGEFDGEPVLRRLGLLDKIDPAKTAAPESRAVRDQRQPL
jgi:hypothetical protein